MKKLDLSFFLMLLIPAGCMQQTSNMEQEGAGDYPIRPVPFTQVRFEDQFWAPRLETVKNVTIPYTLQQCEETGRIKNFSIAAGFTEGDFCGKYPFDDSDVYKILEGVAYSLQVHPDPHLESYADSIIYKIAAAQEEDGYLYSFRSIHPDSNHHMAGTERWKFESEHSHELYNLGHLYEAGVAYYQATGKRQLLDISLKSAGLIYDTFSWGKLEYAPGHQEIEIGLIKLYRLTGDKRFLDLAKFFLDVRGPGGPDYSQQHLKPVQQKQVVGHAVRALYMYSAMTDIAAITGDTSYGKAVDHLWNDLVSQKIYVTGGIGSAGSNEGFTNGFDLPNYSAYNETCASIANVLWNFRLFLLHGDAKYLDVLERTLYNSLSSGLSLNGDRFFYPNPLEARMNRERSPWFTCACCPSNVARFFPSLPGYQYAQREGAVYVNLFAGGKAWIETATGKIEITQTTNYPWDGSVTMSINPEVSARFELYVRIPGWARGEAIPNGLYRFSDSNPKEKVSLAVNGKQTEVRLKNGFALINRKWKKGDRVELLLPMPVREISANEAVTADVGKIALQRGPLVYCLEGQDQPDPRVLNVSLMQVRNFDTQYVDTLLNGVQIIRTNGMINELTESEKVLKKSVGLTAIPYFTWANRKKDNMTVWLPIQESATRPAPGPTIAGRSIVTTSEAKGEIIAANDQLVPSNSTDKEYPYLHWWPNFGTKEWIQYDFEQEETISSSKVYWFDDSPQGGCKVPSTWQLYYKIGNKWEPVKPLTAYTITKNEFDEVTFEPVITTGIRLELLAQDSVSSGIYEWMVK